MLTISRVGLTTVLARVYLDMLRSRRSRRDAIADPEHLRQLEIAVLEPLSLCPGFMAFGMMPQRGALLCR